MARGDCHYSHLVEVVTKNGLLTATAQRQTRGNEPKKRCTIVQVAPGWFEVTRNSGNRRLFKATGQLIQAADAFEAAVKWGTESSFVVATNEFMYLQAGVKSEPLPRR